MRKGGWTAKVEEIDREWIFTRDNSAAPKIVFFTDSYGDAFRRIVAEYFSRAVFINVFLGQEGTEHQFPIDVLIRERPDLVVYLRAEGGVFRPTTNPPGIGDLPKRH
jgi:hypothetical protein